MQFNLVRFPSRFRNVSSGLCVLSANLVWPFSHITITPLPQAVRGLATDAKILYTYTDEAPMYATHSLLPVIRSFTKRVGVKVEKIDLSFAARVLALFPERLSPEQRVPDSLEELGKYVKTPDANLVKLPNVSASIPQLVRRGLSPLFFVSR